MCNGFGGFYHKSWKVYFAEPNAYGDCSHGYTASRLPKDINEDDLVPFEVSKWSGKSFFWDVSSVPYWADAKARKICVKKMKKVKSFWERYKKTTTLAWEEYKKAVPPVLEKYGKAITLAWEEFITQLEQIDGYCADDK